MPELLKISTAECFTHGKVGQEIHAFARGYPLTYPWEISHKEFKLSLVCGLFIPTLSGVEKVLGFEPIPPLYAPDDIKIYDQKRDQTMAIQMATSVRRLTRSHVGIGTSAGIGTGGIALVMNGVTITGTTDIYADLRTSDSDLIMRRQDAGVSTTLHLLEQILTNGFKSDNH